MVSETHIEIKRGSRSACEGFACRSFCSWVLAAGLRARTRAFDPVGVVAV